MDYEFLFDESSQPQALFSSGHEAIATYFNMELKTIVAIDEV
ncbi:MULTISPECIES: YacL family protein [unclassified Oleiphilus]|nr:MULTISPECIES: YacL family protein [unclassified Oleiphilus]